MTRARGRDADMTQGNILRQYIDFALPLTVGLLFQQLYSAVDSIVVGNFVGETALGAVGSTGNIINMLIGVCNGLSLGAGAVISQAYGAKNHERISKAVHTTMLMTFLLCIVATAVGVAIVKPSLQLMRTPDSMLVEATEYLTIYFAGIAGLLIYNMGSAILRAVGDSRRPLYFLMAAGVMNVLGDLLFVCVLGMGVAGVALATVLSQCVSATLTVLCLTGSDGMCHLDIRRLRFYPERFAQIMKIGLPAGMQSVIFNISNVLIQSSINSFGAVAVAGNTAAANVEGFVYISMNSLYQTTLSFTSQNLGAKQYRRIDRILGRSDDMIIVKGVNIYPMQVERVLMAYPEVGQNYVIVLERDGLKDTMKVQVEIREESFVEDMRVLRGLQETIARALTKSSSRPRSNSYSTIPCPAPKARPNASSTSARRVEGRVCEDWRGEGETFCRKFPSPFPRFSSPQPYRYGKSLTSSVGAVFLWSPRVETPPPQ